MQLISNDVDSILAAATFKFDVATVDGKLLARDGAAILWAVRLCQNLFSFTLCRSKSTGSNANVGLSLKRRISSNNAVETEKELIHHQFAD